MAISTLDRKFLDLCKEVRKQSHDPDRQVGAVIADENGFVIASGTNAPPASLNFTPEKSRAETRADPTWKYFFFEHAERNALFRAYAEHKPLLGATMYSTLFPCSDCARAIIAAGLARLVVFDSGRDLVRDQKWDDHHRYARQLFARAGVIVDTFSPEPDRSPESH